MHPITRKIYKQYTVIRRIVKDCHTIKNGKDYCWVKIWSSIGLVFFMYVCQLKIHAGAREFNTQDCFLGICAIIGAGAGASKLKQSTEPE